MLYKSSYLASGTSKSNRDLKYYYSKEDESSGENDDEKRNSGSRLKVEHGCAVLNRSTEYKKFLLYEIKFDELLNLHAIKKATLNLVQMSRTSALRCLRLHG